MNAADEPAFAALMEKGTDALVDRTACARQRIDLLGRKNLRRLRESRDVFVDIIVKRIDP